MGNSTLIGGDGSNRFVLLPNNGISLIADFASGKDLMVLRGGLTLGQLKIVQNGNFSEISIDSSGQTLATLNGIQAKALSVNDFEFSP